MIKLLLVYFCIIKIVEAQKDNNKKIIIKEYGYITINAYALEVNAFYSNNGNYFGCDILYQFQMSKLMYCDLHVFSVICLATKSNFPINFFDDKDFLKVDENAYATLQQTKDLSCGEIKDQMYEMNKNSFKADYETEYFTNDFTNKYYSPLVFFTIVGDDKFFSSVTTFIKFNLLASTRQGITTPLHQKKKIKWITYVDYVSTYMLQEYILIVKCAQSYYGRTCWFHCVDNERLECNCDYQEHYTNVPCIPTCKPGWWSNFITYFVDGIKEVFNICNYKDLCYKKTQCIYDCLPISNTTFYCENVLSLIKSDLYSKNLTSEIFLWNELITISMDYDALNNKDFLKYSDITYNVKDLIFSEKIITLSFFGPTYKIFRVIGNNKIDFSFYFPFKIYFLNWNKYYTKNKPFRIYVRPEHIGVYRDNDNKNIDFKFYIGEKIHCNSSGRPSYRILYIWTSSLLIFEKNMTENIVVSDGLDIQSVDITIYAFLIIYGRNNYKYFQKNIYFIKSFVFFHWNTEKNVLLKTDYLECLYKTYIKSHIIVVQTAGPSMLNTNDKQIKLNNLKGGRYELICTLICGIKGKFVRIIQFLIKTFPTFICLFLYANTYGSIVQCGHNGIFYDTYRITVYLEVFDHNWFVKRQGLEYIRIPYRLKSAIYKIKCVVEYIYNSSIQIQYDVIKTLSEKLTDSYVISNHVSSCPEFARYVEKPLILKSDDYIFVMEHYLFYLFIYEYSNDNLILSIIMITSLYTLIFQFISCERGRRPNIKALKEEISVQMVFLRCRNLHFRLKEISKIQIDTKSTLKFNYNLSDLTS